MRATSTVVVFSSLLLAASAAAGPNDKTEPAKKSPATTGAAGAKAGAKAGATGTTTGAKTGATAGTTTGAGPAQGASAAGAGGDPATNASSPSPSPSPDLASVKPEDMPTAVRMRRLEQQTQALKERAWQLKARVQTLKEQMLGGGAGAQAIIAHANDMGASFRLIKLIYTLDGTQVFARTDETAESLYKTSSFDVFAGPIAPGNHTVSSIATYRGHGYGVFEYLSKYTFTARGNQAFIAGDGKISRVECKGFEKGGPTTPLEKRPVIECTVHQLQPERPAERSGETAAKPGPAGAAPAGGEPAQAPPGAKPTVAPAGAAPSQPGS